MEYQSQIGQDKWVAEYFNQKKDGFFLDIGAYDGVWWNNTYYLEKELGWKGICFEAGLPHYQKLAKNRTCICVRTFVSDKIGITQYEAPNYGGTRRLGPMNVSESTLQVLLPAYQVPNVIDYISIDVEGVEVKVLNGFPFDKYEVGLWTIEHNSYTIGTTHKMNIKAIMERNGYVIAIEDVAHDGHIFEDWYINKKYL